MAQAPRDDNSVPAWLGISSVDGVTPVPIQINAVTGGMKIDTMTTISFSPIDVAGRDENTAESVLAQNETADNILPVYVNPATGAVLIDM